MNDTEIIQNEFIINNTELSKYKYESFKSVIEYIKLKLYINN